MVGRATHDRLHYMDHLRALAMLAGVGFHAALAYSPLMSGFFPTADRQNSAWVDVVVWGLHLVRMPLFFLVAGFFAAWTMARRGGAALARQRVRRILVPFVLAWPLTWLSLSASTGWAVANVQHRSAFLDMVHDWMQSPAPLRPPPATTHLWFLYYLLLFAVLHWVAHTLELGRLGRWVRDRGPLWWMLGLPLLLVPALASVAAPHPAPDGLLPQFWAVVFYGAFFALGMLVQGQPGWLHRLRPMAAWLGTGCAVLYLAFVWRLQIGLSGLAWPLKFLLASSATLALCLLSYQALVRHTPLRHFVG